MFAHDLSLATERFRQRQDLDASAAAFWEREFRRYFGLMAAPPGWAAN
ncbi:hypothetical protein [Nitrospirillum sp. BR 11163]|nr:hypothetical protein [Nitrospirillum sp. BR 11163]MEA1673947.1 hypothetical protein [Nitrospirillum sp. BR 11163]